MLSLLTGLIRIQSSVLEKIQSRDGFGGLDIQKSSLQLVVSLTRQHDEKMQASLNLLFFAQSY
jgi:hypothetical protein